MEPQHEVPREKRKRPEVEDCLEELKAKKKREIESKRDKTLEELIDRREPKLEPSSVLILNVSKDNTLEELLHVLRRFGDVISCHVLGPRTEEEKALLSAHSA